MSARAGSPSKALRSIWRQLPSSLQWVRRQSWANLILFVTFLLALALLLQRSRAGPGWASRVFSVQEKVIRTIEDQTGVIEEIYAARRRAESAALAQLERGSFDDGVSLTSGSRAGQLVWDFFTPAYTCPTREWVGRPGSPGVWLCGVRTLLQNPDCVIYSFGASGDAALERALRRQTRCKIVVFDPMLTFQEQLALERIGGISFYGHGLGARDGAVRIKDPRQGPGRNISQFQAKTLASIMLDLGNEWVDVIRLDIQGMEWDVLQSWLTAYRSAPLPFSQLAVKYHWWQNSSVTPSGRAMLGVLEGLPQATMRPFTAVPCLSCGDSPPSLMDYSYIQVGIDGRYIVPEDDSAQVAPDG